MSLKSKLGFYERKILIRDRVYVLAIEHELKLLGTTLDPVHQNSIWDDEYAHLFEKIYTPRKSSNEIYKEIQRERGITV